MKIFKWKNRKRRMEDARIVKHDILKVTDDSGNLVMRITHDGIVHLDDKNAYEAAIQLVKGMARGFTSELSCHPNNWRRHQ